MAILGGLFAVAAVGAEHYSLLQSRSLAVEAYRTLRTNLQFSSLDRPLRSLVVTSGPLADATSEALPDLPVGTDALVGYAQPFVRAVLAAPFEQHLVADADT